MLRWLKWLLAFRKFRRDARTRAVVEAARALSWEQRLSFVFGVVRDPRLPIRVRLAPFLLAAYLAAPIDFIPDFVPVLGQLDDLAVMGMLLRLVQRSMPPDLLQDHLRRVTTDRR